MKNLEKYTKNIFMPPKISDNWTKKTSINHAPAWCSVDLRDGNQALITPMSLNEKLTYFKMLVDIGFKEIEVGFPAASETEYKFLRRLVEDNLIPDDVTIQVLTQSRSHIIKKTFDALDGVKNAIVHLYNSTSVAQREQVFKKSKKEIIGIAAEGARLFNEYAKEKNGNFKFEYSPESFSGTEMEFALEICNEVLNIWKPDNEHKVIINLPNTVELAMPHVYAGQVEYISENIEYRENVIISLHPHNDRGCAVAAAEMGILAGAERVEGTLFGNGERTGNTDIMTMAMNMYSQGTDPKLNFGDMPHICEVYENLTNMHIGDRHPYAGRLVYAAFSGSHQDAIAKGMKWYSEGKSKYWSVPYLPIDPTDVGRAYDKDVIRINSQSGKGGISYILEQNYGYSLPQKMRESFGYYVKSISDKQHHELMPGEIFEIFAGEYVNRNDKYDIAEYHISRENGTKANITISENGKTEYSEAYGNGRLDAVSNAVKAVTSLEYRIVEYHEHALSQGSDSLAAAYVAVSTPDGSTVWGCGTDSDIITASVKALVSAVNRMMQQA